MTGISYGLLDMQADGIFVTDTDVFSAPRKVLQSERLAEEDGAVIVKSSYDPKVFSVEGYLKADDIEDLDDLLDTFKLALNQEGQNFDVDYSGSTRRFVATPQNLIISRPKGLNVANFSVEFYCESPVGMDTSSSILLSGTTITVSSIITSITVQGTYKVEPLITITLNSGTGLTTNKSITISNDTSLRGVTVTRDWTAGDVLEIDVLNKKLYVNDAVVPFSGQFPKWEPGSGGIAYLDDFTTRNVTLAATYTRRYL